MKKLTIGFIALIIFSISGLANSPSDQPVFVKEFIGQVDFIEGRLLQLEGAMSQEQMSWAPAEGVRNVAQIYLHTAEAN